MPVNCLICWQLGRYKVAPMGFSEFTHDKITLYDEQG
jgi:hypothetical protein